MKYILATNFGEGFITHADQETNGMTFQGFPGDIWVIEGGTEVCSAWITRTSGTEKTLVQAQAIVDATDPRDENNNPMTITLPS